MKKFIQKMNQKFTRTKPPGTVGGKEKNNGMSLYLIYAYDKTTKIEEVVDWDRSADQAAMKMKTWEGYGHILRIAKHIVNKDHLQTLRKTSLNVLVFMESDLPRTIKKIKADKDNSLIIKHHLNSKIAIAKERFEGDLDYIYDDEVEKHIQAINAGIIT